MSNPALDLALGLPPAKGHKGAATTLADLARLARAGVFCREHIRHMAHCCIARNLSPGFHGTGSRARRRELKRMNTRLARYQPTPRADLLAEEKTEGYARRHFRTNIHD